METLKLVFYILGSAAFLGLIIFFIALIFNKDDGIDLEQGRIDYLSRVVDRLDKKIDKYALGKECPLDFAEADKFEAKEKKYVEKIRQLEKILVAKEIKLSVDGQVTNMKAAKLKYEKYELNLEKSHLQNEIERLNSLLELNERKYVNLLDFVIFKHKNGITTVDIDFKKTRDKIEKLIEESNKKTK